MPQKCYHFYFWYLAILFPKTYSFVIYMIIFCIYNYSELVFCMEVKILLCLHFAYFNDTLLHICATFFVVNILHALSPLFKHIIMFDISKVLKK
jgi:hypothetical protein